MHNVKTIKKLKQQIGQWRRQGDSIALVPTMGNLHAGHLALVERAQELSARTAVSIFVNPSQFVAGEDFTRYPRTIKRDRAKLTAMDVDLLFMPEVSEIYPQGLGAHTQVTVPQLDNILCGAFRPGHFRGVATVVGKLLNLVQPDIAVFGQKDYQQLLVIKHLVKDLCMPVEIFSVKTIREATGLAISSRNRYLSKQEKQIAPKLYQQLQAVAGAAKHADSGFNTLEKQAIASLKQAGFKPEYFSIRNSANLGPPTGPERIVMAAAWLGQARLIDNILM